jgi:hypothetical protein
LQKAFCGKTTLVPEMTFHGAVIVLAMPSLSSWSEDGIIGQMLFKYIWERAVLSRNGLALKHRERPVLLWCDEAQETILSEDAHFIGLARESKCASVFMTQSLPTYYGKIGGDTPREDAASLVGKFGTHLFLANSCPETNEFAARMIGKVVTKRRTFNEGTSRSVNTGMSAGASENSGTSSNYGHSSGYTSGQSHNYNSNSGSGHTHGTGNNWGENRGKAQSDNKSHGFSETMEYAFEPGDFGRRLQTGGPANGNIVTGIWYQSGSSYRSDITNTFLARFKQR